MTEQAKFELEKRYFMIVLIIGIIIGLFLSGLNTPKYYCTTEEHNRLLATQPSVCGRGEDYSDEYGGLIKIKGKW